MKKTLILLFVVSIACADLLLAQSAVRDHQNGSPDDPSLMYFLFLDNDGGISNISDLPAVQCINSIAPAIVIENYGSNTLTSATLQYFIDGGIPQNYYWTGSLYPLFKDTVVLPAISVSPGTHTFNVMVTQANGEVDINGGNDGSITFNIMGQSEPVPYSEEFASSSMLPEGYFIDNENQGVTWKLFSNFILQSSNSAMQMPFYVNDISGDLDNLYMRNVDLSNSVAPQLSFNLAYAYYSEHYWDELLILISTDCGHYWDIAYDKAKDDLATAPFTDVDFVPAHSDEWRTETVDLSAYSGISDVVIKFQAISGHGNNLYIDKINIGENTGIYDMNNGSESLRIFPNPAIGETTVIIPKSATGYNTLEAVNLLGQRVFSTIIHSQDQCTIPVREFTPGTYFITLSTQGSQTTSEPLIVIH